MNEFSPVSPEEAAEMAQFGLDPTIPRDVEEWAVTAPENQSSVVDYSQDTFEFGGQPQDPIE